MPDQSPAAEVAPDQRIPAASGQLDAALRIDELLEQLLNRIGEVVAARERLRKLLSANRSILSELSLPAVLRRVVECACDLLGARYAALGVIGSDGNLEQFIHTGMSADRVAAVGALPQGKGLLGALITDPRPISLADLRSDPRAGGFPPHHPDMRSFLGVPIRLRDEVYGNLYLTESHTGEFTEEDTELLISLAGTAAIAIENARLFQDSRRRQDWLQASTEITRRLMTEDDSAALGDIAEQVKVMADADVVTVVLPHGLNQLRVEVATGQGAADLTGLVYDLDHTLSQAAIETGEPIRLSGASNSRNLRVHLAEVVKGGPVMALPLSGSGATRGVLVVGRLPGRSAFSLSELDMAATFAGHAAVALELSDARAAADRLSLLEERDRIARDLHDHVIQRLFATGLTVQSVVAGRAPDSIAKLSRVVDDIDDTIRQIRTSIFALHGAPAGVPSTVRAHLMGIVDAVAATMDTPPRIKFAGPIETLVSATLLDNVQAVMREALTNIARHSRADNVEVELTVADGWLTLELNDNGVGIGQATRRSGLDNMRHRAESLGGRFELASAPQKGTSLKWTAPLI